jgi:nucleoside 2-deoxyribosyltransferase
MAFQSTAYRVLIASPSDLAEERQVATDAIAEWNNQHASTEGVVLLPEKFETHATPQAEIRPQQAINEQLVSKCDILIAMFWTKYGNNTGVAESGTVEEIDQAVEAGKPVMLYFSARPIDPNKIDLEQQVKLKKFKEDTFKKALVGKFTDFAELHRILLRDLVKLVRSLRSREELHEKDELRIQERRTRSLEAAQKIMEPYINAFLSPKLRLWIGPRSSTAEIVAREELRLLKRQPLRITLAHLSKCSMLIFSNMHSSEPQK